MKIMATDNLSDLMDDLQLPRFPYCQPVSVKVCAHNCGTKTFRVSVYNVLSRVGNAMMQYKIGQGGQGSAFHAISWDEIRNEKVPVALKAFRRSRHSRNDHIPPREIVAVCVDIH